MKTVTTYFDKNNNRTTKEKAWTVMTQVYNDAGNLQRTGYSKGAAQVAAEEKADDSTVLKLKDADGEDVKSYNGNIVKVGRDASCHMVIDLKADKKKIDKVHAIFELKMGKWQIMNISKNGVWVNDVALPVNGSKVLEKGDQINFAHKKEYIFI